MSPYEQLPLKVPVALIHGTRDGQVPIEQSRRYAAAATKAGDTVKLTELPHIGHFELIDTHHQAWQTCRSRNPTPTYPLSTPTSHHLPVTRRPRGLPGWGKRAGHVGFGGGWRRLASAVDEGIGFGDGQSSPVVGTAT